MVFTVSLASSLIRKWQESFDERLKQLRHIQQRMKSASSYAEWREFAQQLDKMGHHRGGDQSGKIRENLYDRKLLQQKLRHLQSTREKGNVKEMMFGLRTDLIRNIANIAKRCGFPCSSLALQSQQKPALSSNAAAVTSCYINICSATC